MTRSKRGPSKRRRTTDPAPMGTGGFWRSIGNFETINGLPHGPLAVAGAIALALVVVPLSWAVRQVRRR